MKFFSPAMFAKTCLGTVQNFSSTQAGVWGFYLVWIKSVPPFFLKKSPRPILFQWKKSPPPFFSVPRIRIFFRLPAVTCEFMYPWVTLTPPVSVGLKIETWLSENWFDWILGWVMSLLWVTPLPPVSHFIMFYFLFLFIFIIFYLYYHLFPPPPSDKLFAWPLVDVKKNQKMWNLPASIYLWLVPVYSHSAPFYSSYVFGTSQSICKITYIRYTSQSKRISSRGPSPRIRIFFVFLP